MLIETLLTLLVLTTAFVSPGFGHGALRAVRGWLRVICRHPLP
jgi:hypothetical protein